MFTVFNGLIDKETSEIKFCVEKYKSILDFPFFNKLDLFEVPEDKLSDFLKYFCLPLSKSKLEKFDTKTDEYKTLNLFNVSKLDKDNTLYTFNSGDFLAYKAFIIKKFLEKKDTFCNDVTTIGYKYFDTNSSIFGNKEIVLDRTYQDFDIINLKSHNFYFMVRQFVYKNQKTSIYEEIKKYKTNQNYFTEIKNIFEDTYFKYDDVSINKIVESEPRSNVFIRCENEYKTVSPVPTISQILFFNDIFKKVNYKKIGSTYVGGAQPQNVGFFGSLFSGEFKCYENILEFKENKNSVYQIKYNLIPNDSFNKFNERRTFKKINHLNMIISNHKTDKNLQKEINLILDDLLELVFLTIDYIKQSPEDPLSLADNDNYKLILSLFEPSQQNINNFSDKIKEEIFQNLRISKKLKYYNKREKLFDNIIKLTLEKVLNYV